MILILVEKVLKNEWGGVLHDLLTIKKVYFSMFPDLAQFIWINVIICNLLLVKLIQQELENGLFIKGTLISTSQIIPIYR